MAANLENKINRIASNVTAALTAIAEKGVDVPDGADSDDLESLISAIQQRTEDTETWIFTLEDGVEVEKDVSGWMQIDCSGQESDISIDENTLLLVHGDTVSDASQYERQLSNDGAEIKTCAGSLNEKVLYFDGTSKVNLPIGDYFNFGGGDFTIEWREKVQTNSGVPGNPFTFKNNDPYYFLWHYNDGIIYLYYGATYNETIIAQTSLNAWVHRAFVRKRSVLYVFQDGNLVWSGAINENSPNTVNYQMCIGGRSDADQFFIGYMEEFRVSNVARWTGNFVPHDKVYGSLDDGTDDTNFRGATNISIPEGNVIRITRKSDGGLIWEKTTGSNDVYTVNIINAPATGTGVYGQLSNNNGKHEMYVEIDGQKLTAVGESITVPAGTTMRCYNGAGVMFTQIAINGQTVAEVSSKSAEYDYTVNGNIDVFFGQHTMNALLGIYEK